MSLSNPYKGLFPYTPKDERLFFGREKESLDLVDMIKRNKLVVVFGESGTGKTSLINAKLFPSLRNQYYFPIYIRINFSSPHSPISQTREIIFRELSSWDSSIPNFEPDTSLLEFAARTSVFKGLVKPILFFDQFEELFTISPRYNSQHNTEELISQLAELIETDRLSDKYLERESTKKQELGIDEQHENILRFKVVFSLRQDFIAQLDDLRFKIPSIVSSRYRIKKFNYIQAYEAIVGPPWEIIKDFSAREKNAEIITEDAAFQSIKELGRPTLTTAEDINLMKHILQSVSKRFSFHEHKDLEHLEFDPTIVSLYCYQLFEDSLKNNDDLPQITLEQVRSSPYDQIIKRYYDSSFVKRRIKYAIEKFLITPDGRRVLIPLKDFVLKAKISEKEIEELRQKTAILRIYGKDEDREVEIAHDQIAKRALISKKEREANRIKRNAAIISLTALVVVTLSIIVSLYYIRQKEKLVEIQYLQKVNDSLNNQRDRLSTNLRKVENNYNEALTKQNTLVTDKDEINKQIYLIKNQLSSEVDRNYKLSSELISTKRENDINKKNYSQSINEISNVKKEVASLEKEITYANARIKSFTSDLAEIQEKNNRLQNENLTWQARYKSKVDSLGILRTENKNLKDQLNKKPVINNKKADSASKQ